MTLDRSLVQSVDHLIELRRTGAMLPSTFCGRVLDQANPTNAAALLSHLPEEERSEFEWWFVMRNGDRAPAERSFTVLPMQIVEDELGPEDTHDAVHRAILARREAAWA